MKVLHSILKVRSPQRESVVVVCETLADEIEVVRLAKNEGCTVTNVAGNCADSENAPIYLNDFKF